MRQTHRNVTTLKDANNKITPAAKNWKDLKKIMTFFWVGEVKDTMQKNDKLRAMIYCKFRNHSCKNNTLKRLSSQLKYTSSCSVKALLE